MAAAPAFTSSSNSQGSEKLEEQETEVGPAGSDRLARHRDLHVWLHGQARRRRLVVDLFEEPVPHAERDVAEAGVVPRPSHARTYLHDEPPARAPRPRALRGGSRGRKPA